MIDDVIEFNVDFLNINFEGVGQYQNKKVCIKNVLPNERVQAKVVYEKQNFIFAKLLKVISKNPARIEPKCKYYDICGGCPLQILDPKEALKMKANIIKDYFLQFYNKELKATSSSDNFFYRNKVVFSVKNNSVVGLKKEDSNSIVKIDKCIIADQIINKVLERLTLWLKQTKLDFVVRYFVVRQYENNFILTIVIDKRPEHKKFLDVLINYLKENFDPNSFGVFINKNKNKNEILGYEWQHIYGLKNLLINTNSIVAPIHPYSFLQVNYDVMKKLYLKVLENISQNDVVIEGYSGAGLLSSMIAKKANKVFSIEINKNATSDANKLKEQNNIKNLENINGSCSDIIPNIKIETDKTIFVLDPPQSGCDKKVLEKIKQNKIKKIVYISCNPYTLKQNVCYLSDCYEIESMEIFDMFPNTSHVECVCVLKLR